MLGLKAWATIALLEPASVSKGLSLKGVGVAYLGCLLGELSEPYLVQEALRLGVPASRVCQST